jgi:hypothetical protein
MRLSLAVVVLVGTWVVVVLVDIDISPINL